MSFQYNPDMKLSVILTAIQSLFKNINPEPEHWLNHEAGKLYVSNRAEFYRRVRATI